MTRPSADMPLPLSRPRPRNPSDALHRNACPEADLPATTDPFPETASAVMQQPSSCIWPSSTMPPVAVQRKALNSLKNLTLSPTTTDPSADTANPLLKKLPPGRSPRPTIPPAKVQRNASRPELTLLNPTTTVPSADTARASLFKFPERNPRPRKTGASDAAAIKPGLK